MNECGKEGESEGHCNQRPSRRLERKQGIVGSIGAGIGVHHLHKVGVLGISDSDHGMHLFDQLLFLIIIKLHVPLGQASLAGPVLDEDEADLGAAGGRSESREGGPVLHPTAPPIATR